MNANRKEIVPNGAETFKKSGRAARKLLLKPVHPGRGLPLGFSAVGLIAGLSLIPAARLTAQTFRTLHHFSATACIGCPNSDGAFPAGFALSGNTLYGTAQQGGSSGFGTVFAINTDGTGFTNLHSFPELPPPLYSTNSDGAYPAELLLSGNTLYGTAGGGSAGNGTIFALKTDGTGFRILHTFTATTSDGAHPFGLLLSGNTLYGAAGGGTSGNGMVFALNTDGTGFTNLYSFTASDGGGGPIWLISSNTLYGTGGGGSLNSGTVFALNTDGTGFTNLYTFTPAPAPRYTNSDGVGPGGLCLSGNTLYGVAGAGGPYWSAKFSGTWGNGTVFALNTDGTGFRTLHSFTASSQFPNLINSDGVSPIGGLILSGNTLYGTAHQGGTSGWGTAFALNTNGTGFTNLHSFTQISNPDSGYGANGDGALPQTALLLSGNALYGTAFGGGTGANGTAFSLSFRPQLTITPSGTNAILSWPTNVAGFDYTGYTLQSAPALTGTFTNLPAATNPYTNPITGPQQFFRLSQ